MKTIITTNPNTITGYELRVIHDDGIVDVTPIEKITHDGKSLILPENPANRKFWALSRLVGDTIELTYKETKTFGPRNSTPTPKAPSKGLEEYLEGEDKELYLKLIEKANRNKAIAMKKAEIEALMAQLNEMEAQA